MQAGGAALCIETLLVTILCWVAVFGVVDTLVSRLQTDTERLAAYALVGGLAAVLALGFGHVTVCSLL
jgi:uncharacterized membrane protein YgaE (UPF0421/DUF939 family)